MFIILIKSVFDIFIEIFNIFIEKSSYELPKNDDNQ